MTSGALRRWRSRGLSMIRHVFAFLLVAVLANAAYGQDATKNSKPDAAKADPPKLTSSQTTHSISVGGKQIEYQAEAGTLTLKEEDGKATANIFYVAYTKTRENPATRRLTFCFNGGPGSSSVWLHMGAFGPRRVVLSEIGEAMTPAAKTVENEWSLL